MASPKNTKTPPNTQTALISTPSFTKTPYTPNNLRFYGLFTLPHTFFTPPSYIDHDISIFHPFAKFKKLNKGALDEVTLEDGNTIHLYLPPRKKFRQPIFVGDDFPVVSDVEPSSDEEDSTARSYDPESPRLYRPGKGPYRLPPNEEDYVKITVSSLVFHDPGVDYCISVTESFARIYDDYALRCDYWPEQISICYGGGEVGRNDTPMELCMNGEAHCICYGKEADMNLDTRYKVFVIQEAHEDPIEMGVRAKITLPMIAVYKYWSNRSGLNYENLVLVRRNRVKPKVGLVCQAGIRNGDRLFSMVMEL